MNERCGMDLNKAIEILRHEQMLNRRVSKMEKIFFCEMRGGGDDVADAIELVLVKLEECGVGIAPSGG